MSLVDKFIGRKKTDSSKANGTSVADGALDTLDSILRTTGELSFPLEDEDPRFLDLCREYARHVTNGAPILDEGIEESQDGARQWGRVRQFFRDRRQAEHDFVASRTESYRELIEGMVVALAQIADTEANTQRKIEHHLSHVTGAAERGDLNAVRRSLSEAIAATAVAFEQQRSSFVAQMDNTQNNLVRLRDDFASARESMKRDTLTGTFNDESFTVALEQAIKLDFVLQQPVAVAIIHIERFQDIMTNSGSAAAEEVVCSVADCMMRCFVRRSDTVATLGEGRFAVLLTDTTEEMADTLLNRLKAMVHDTVRIPYAPATEQVTCATGLSMLTFQDTPGDVIRRAAAQIPGRDTTGNYRQHTA
ncbi:MAG: diguanylate cyclase [Pseudomonadota bacterium]